MRSRRNDRCVAGTSGRAVACATGDPITLREWRDFVTGILMKTCYTQTRPQVVAPRTDRPGSGAPRAPTARHRASAPGRPPHPERHFLTNRDNPVLAMD